MILLLPGAVCETEIETYFIPPKGILCYNDPMEILQQILLMPETVQAYTTQPFGMVIGTNLNPTQVLTNIARFLMAMGGFVCITVFMLGAFYMVFSRGKEDLLQKGKDLMIGAVVGLAVILGAYGIIRTFFYVLYVI